MFRMSLIVSCLVVLIFLFSLVFNLFFVRTLSSYSSVDTDELSSLMWINWAMVALSPD